MEKWERCLCPEELVVPEKASAGLSQIRVRGPLEEFRRQEDGGELPNS